MVEQAGYCESFVPAFKPYTKQTSEGRKAEKLSANSGSASASKDISRGNNEAPEKGEQSSGKKNGKTAPKVPKCLNPDCKEHHFLRDCTVTPPEKARTLLEVYRNRRSSVKRLQSKVPRTGKQAGRMDALLADTVSVVVNGDYGADHAAISSTHLKLLAEAGVYVLLLPLKTPVRMQLLMESKHSDISTCVVAHQKARISTTLRTAAEPLRLKNVEYLVFEEHMDEVLLSRPVLQSLGFNLDNHLTAVRNTFHDADFAHIGFSPKIFDPKKDTPPTTPGRLASLLLGSELMPTNSNENVVDPVFYGDGVCSDDEGDADATIGEQNENELSSDINNMLEKAVENGLPEEYREDLSTLLDKYAHIFRSSLGNDPPANVTPMRIRLKPNAKPVRAAFRRYSPPQLQFIRRKIAQLEEIHTAAGLLHH